jgi:solute:Na+ symporter, SSS family
VPALLYGTGAIGFFAVPHTIVVYSIVMFARGRMWSVSHKHGYATAGPGACSSRFFGSPAALVVHHALRIAPDRTVTIDPVIAQC